MKIVEQTFQSAGRLESLPHTVYFQSGKQKTGVDIRPWSDDDLPLLERLRGDPAMNVYLGGPEPLEKIRQRHERYRRSGHSGKIHMFVIVVGPERVAAGSVGYWEKDLSSIQASNPTLCHQNA
jgi:RimJ/RimL family protein N-acetyltransferase